MFAPITKILLCLVLCLGLLSCDNFCLGCQTCEKYQDVARVENSRHYETHIDSVVIIANDSIMGCGNHQYSGTIGSKTHHIKFPINASIQLFSQGDLWKELLFKMDKNTVLSVYGKLGCLDDLSPFTFLNRMESAKKHKRFIDSFFAEDYCWLLEKMDDSYENLRCTKWNVDGEGDYIESFECH